MTTHLQILRNQERIIALAGEIQTLIHGLNVPAGLAQQFQPTTIPQIKAAVAKAFDKPAHIFTSKAKPTSAAWPRQVAMALSRELTPFTLREIGKEFGGRDTGTVLHAVKAVQDRCDAEPDTTGKLVNELRKQLTATNGIRLAA